MSHKEDRWPADFKDICIHSETGTHCHNVSHHLTICHYFDLGVGVDYIEERICLSCLSVYVPLRHIFTIFYVCYLWLLLGASLAALRYVMNFRFMVGDRHRETTCSQSD